MESKLFSLVTLPTLCTYPFFYLDLTTGITSVRILSGLLSSYKNIYVCASI